MPRFVLLYHECPPTYVRPSHWDFMLEDGDVLRTWALCQLPQSWNDAHNLTTASFPNCPPLADRNTVPAEQLGDHRSDYLEFEGPVSGDRGSVTRVAAGTYACESDLPECQVICLTANAIAGRIELRHATSDGTNWTLTVLNSH